MTQNLADSLTVTGLSAPAATAIANAIAANAVALGPVFVNQLPKTRASLARVLGGTGRARWLFLGDSITAGFNDSTNAITESSAASFPARLAQLLTARGYPARIAGINGTQGFTPAQQVIYDPRIAFGANVGNFARPGIGFALLATSGGGTAANNTISFTPEVNCDTVQIFYYTVAEGGSFTVNVAGGSTLATINTNGAESLVASAPIALGALSQGQINLVGPTAASTFMIIAAVLAYNSTVPGIDMVNAGTGGATVATYTSATQPFMFPFPSQPANSPIASALIYDFDLAVICLGVNDFQPANFASLVQGGSYVGGLTNLINAYQAAGTDVVLLVPPPISSTVTALNTQAQMVATLQQIAAQFVNPPVLIRWDQRWGSWLQSSANGLNGSTNNTIHPGAAGYGDAAAMIADSLQ